jgi:hypothetical protein
VARVTEGVTPFFPQGRRGVPPAAQRGVFRHRPPILGSYSSSLLSSSEASTFSFSLAFFCVFDGVRLCWKANVRFTPATLFVYTQYLNQTLDISSLFSHVASAVADAQPEDPVGFILNTMKALKEVRHSLYSTLSNSYFTKRALC